MTSIDCDRLPTFITIGAAKSGTTSLHFYLDQHPEISMSSPKETNFFERSDAVESLHEYQLYFRRGFVARGESSVHYTCYPTIAGVPQRIASALPDIKLVYVVRDPVERAIAHYHESYQSNAAPRSVIEAFTDLDDPSKVWVWTSRYSVQMERYLEYFDRSRVLVVDARDLLQHRSGTLETVFAFLGVDPGFASPRFHDELNVRHGRRKRLTRPGQALKHSALANAVRRNVPESLRRRLFGVARAATSVSVRRRSLPLEIRRQLEDWLREDARRFREIADMPFDHWSV